MPNWCGNSIAFYQEDGGTTMVEAFYTDIKKYEDFTDPETGKHSDWVGHWLESNRIDTENLYTRGFINNCELNGDHVRVDMETAWAPLPEVWDLMADKYDLAYVYIAEESGCEVYVNTDSEGRFFTTRYMMHYFELDNLGLDADTLAEFGERLREMEGETLYFDSFDDVAEQFEGFGFNCSDLDELNAKLEAFNLQVYAFNSDE